MVDLIINGITQTLNGLHTYDNVQIINGGILYVTAYDGSLDTGMLEIHANNILVDATSQINADARGFRGQYNALPGEGPGGGLGIGFSGPGAGYGGRGGSSFYGNIHGSIYGTLSGPDIEKGSGGGASDYFGAYGRGGNGGGLIALYANTITINGIISSNGDIGVAGAGQHGSAGGSGGGILIGGNLVTFTGTIRANGGPGSDSIVHPDPRYGGNGAGGGRIKIFYTDPASVISGTTSTDPGNGGLARGTGGIDGDAGRVGTIYDGISGNLQITAYDIRSNILPMAQIYIDNELQNVVNPFDITGLIPDVSHTYKITNTGYYDATGSVTIAEGETRIFDITLILISDIVATEIIPANTVCSTPCDQTVDIRWTNVGSVPHDFYPAIVLDGLRTELTTIVTLNPGQFVTITFSVTGLSVGDHTICADPNTYPCITIRVLPQCIVIISEPTSPYSGFIGDPIHVIINAIVTDPCTIELRDIDTQTLLGSCSITDPLTGTCTTDISTTGMSSGIYNIAAYINTPQQCVSPPIEITLRQRTPANILSTAIIPSVTTCTSPCDLTVDITWENNGETTGILIPTILVNSIPTSLTPENLDPGSSVTHTFPLTSLVAGDYDICADPNTLQCSTVTVQGIASSGSIALALLPIGFLLFMMSKREKKE